MENPLGRASVRSKIEKFPEPIEMGLELEPQRPLVLTEDERKVKEDAEVDAMVAAKDWEEMVQLVLIGEGDRLRQRKSEDEEVQEFLDNVTAFQVCDDPGPSLEDFVLSWGLAEKFAAVSRRAKRFMVAWGGKKMEWRTETNSKTDRVFPLRCSLRGSGRTEKGKTNFLPFSCRDLSSLISRSHLRRRSR